MAQKIGERLAKYPYLEARIEALLNIAENTSGSIEKADDAEDFLIEEVRKMSQALLTQWAHNQESKKAGAAQIENPNLISHTKKNSIGIQPTE